MLDVLGVGRRLLCRRLWRRRCLGPSSSDGGAGKDRDDVVRRRGKALVRLLTKILTTSQLQALDRAVERRTYITQLSGRSRNWS